MNIEIITTPNEELKESGFGSLKACNNVLESIRNMGHTVILTVCSTKNGLEEVVKRNPDIVLLAVKYLSFVTNFTEFESKILSLHDTFKLPILVEEYLEGKEFTVAVIETTNGELIVSPIEIIPLVSTNGLRILGQQAKKDDTEVLKKIKDDSMKIKLVKLATDAFNGLGVRDYGRIDIKTNKAGECFFMEANLVPGMTQGSSYFPKACEIENELTYDNVIELML